MSKNRFKHWGEHPPQTTLDSYRYCKVCRQWRRGPFFDRPLLSNGGKP